MSVARWRSPGLLGSPWNLCRSCVWRRFALVEHESLDLAHDSKQDRVKTKRKKKGRRAGGVGGLGVDAVDRKASFLPAAMGMLRSSNSAAWRRVLVMV